MQMFFDAADSKSCFQKRSTREDISQYSNQKIIYNVLGSSPCLQKWYKIVNYSRISYLL